MAMKINVVPYRPEWPTLFQGEKEKLSQVINEDNLINILHIGSTSVPGLSAKPVIDMLVVVKDINQLDQDNNQIASLGYLSMGSLVFLVEDISVKEKTVVHIIFTHFSMIICMILVVIV